MMTDSFEPYERKLLCVDNSFSLLRVSAGWWTPWPCVVVSPPLALCLLWACCVWPADTWTAMASQWIADIRNTQVVPIIHQCRLCADFNCSKQRLFSSSFAAPCDTLMTGQSCIRQGGWLFTVKAFALLLVHSQDSETLLVWIKDVSAHMVFVIVRLEPMRMYMSGH